MGLVTESLQKTRRAASPPERLPTGFFTSSPEKRTIPKLPRTKPMTSVGTHSQSQASTLCLLPLWVSEWSCEK